MSSMASMTETSTPPTIAAMSMRTSTTSSAIASASSGMGDMDMGMGGGGNSCKISVSVRLTMQHCATADNVCNRCCGIGIPWTHVRDHSLSRASIVAHNSLGFISSTWQNKTSGAFAGSCIGVILLVMVLEALRRAAQEYDAYLNRTHAAPNAASPSSAAARDCGSGYNKQASSQAVPATTSITPTARFTPSIYQQLVRALLHMLQFAVAYFIMLLAMYYNGYIIICIFIGAFVGYFVFGWHSITLP